MAPYQHLGSHTNHHHPRLFTSLTHANGLYLALADDGTAWFDLGNGWEQLDPLPAREVQG